MSRCKGCGGEFRAGKRRSLLDDKGALRSVVVCSKCAGRCLHILVTTAPPPRPPAQIDGRELLEGIRDQLRGILRASAKMGSKISAGQELYQDGRRAGLETAWQLIESTLKDHRRVG